MLDLPEHLGLFLVDAVSFTFVVGVFLGIKSSTSLPLYSKEFLKDDIRYQESYKDPTVSPGMMSILSHVTPIVLIAILCLLRALQTEGFNTGLRSAVAPQKLGRVKVPPPVMAGLFYTGYFLFGACLMASLVKCIAHMAGELAPNFLAVCRPNYTVGVELFTREICTGDLKEIYKASLSFPSQYAAHLSFGFVFNTLVVFCIPQLKKIPMTQHLLMFVMIAVPLMGSLTRYTEGYNSLGDVFAGLVIGTVSAIYFIIAPLRLFGLLGNSPMDGKAGGPTTRPTVTFDQLSSLPYTDLDVELDEQ